ncbi:unnamed protein product [Mytilus coruscus]|uniref:Uncharacterized protein n=1 Tax=Mytilus coruscus TaxID=42192 RepID=A0A6J8C8W5_MYTCO|nr:unnamed protein product [Mytilus coruscus]
MQQSKLESKTSQLTIGLIIVQLKDKYNIQMEFKDMSFLFSTLLPKQDKNKKTCPDLEGLKTCFHSNEMYSVISKRLLCQMKKMMSGSKPNWLLCIPLLHYVQGLYHPYQAVPEKVDHKGDKPVWWGSDSFNVELQKFKSQKWDRSPKEMLQFLLPYFDLDFLLPRTFVASLNLNQFMELDIEHFSPDILLGAVYYFINTQEELANESWVYLHKSMLSKVSSLICKLDCKRREVLEMTRRAYKIGADVLDQCFKTKIDHTLQTTLCLSAAETYFCCIHIFENCLKEHKGKDSKFREDFRTYENKIIERLVLAEHFTDSTYKWLMVWNDGLKINIPEGEVKNGFIKLAQTKLEYALNSRTEIDKLKEVLDVYCDHLENFSGKLQEVLSKSAFQAIEKCACFLELDKLADGIGENRLKHYGELLSYVFERSFDSQKVTDQESFLAHAVSWPSFAVFLKMYSK